MVFDQLRRVWRASPLILASILASTLAAAAATAVEPAVEQSKTTPTVETVAEPLPSVEDPRAPSSFVFRLRLGELFARGYGLGDALQAVPGVWVQRQSSPGQPAYASIRGGNARQLAVYLDGMRLSAPAGVGLDVGALSLPGIDAVDVHRGSAAVFRGSGSLSGALELHSGATDREPGWSAEATTHAGSFSTLGAEAVVEAADATSSARVAGSWRRSQGDFAFIDGQGTLERRINNDHERRALLATAAHDFGATEVGATLLHDSGERGAPGPSEFQRRFADARIDDGRNAASLRLRHRGVLSGEWGALDLSERAGVQWRSLDYRNPNAFLGGGAISNGSDYAALSAGAAALTAFEAGHVAHLDLDGRVERYEARQDGAIASLVDARRNTIALAAADEIFLLSERLSIYLAGRVEAIDDSSSGDLDEAAVTSDRVAWLPALGLTYRPARWLLARANVARTFRTPDFDELFLATEVLRGNPALEPERAWNADLGVRVGEEDGWIELVGFEHRIDSLILFLPVSSYLTRAQNLQEATSRGVEAAAGWAPHRRLAARSSYTYTHARLDDGARVQLPRQPEHRAHLRVEAELAGDGWLPGRSLRLWGEAMWRSQVNLDLFGHLTSPAYVTGDLGLTLQPLRWVRLGLTCRNVLDRRDRIDALQQPLPGRAWYGSISLTTGGEVD